jgi:hypothetical protein
MIIVVVVAEDRSGVSFLDPYQVVDLRFYPKTWEHFENATYDFLF